jgi:hypothetical protein
VGGRYVGIDLHRRRSVIYTMDAGGEKLDCVRIANDALGLLEQVSRAGSDCEVVLEATYRRRGRAAGSDAGRPVAKRCGCDLLTHAQTRPCGYLHSREQATAVVQGREHEDVRSRLGRVGGRRDRRTPSLEEERPTSRDTAT